METFKFIYEYDGVDERIDRFLSTELDHLSRSYVQKLIEEGIITVNNEKTKNNYILRDGDEIDIVLPDLAPSLIEKENIPLDIVYEDDDIIVINKPSGMVVHPAVGNKTGTLVNALLYHTKDLSGINGISRPGIVHRIDKDTSGLLVVCKNDYSHKIMADEFANKEVDKIYYAICSGVIPHNVGLIDAPIARDVQDRQKMTVSENGKPAITHFKVLERFKEHTLIEVKLETGRTHQIRVHMKYIGYPISGDHIYGYKKEEAETGQYLHAKKIGFKHPRTGKYLEFDTGLPKYFSDFLNELRDNYKRGDE